MSRLDQFNALMSYIEENPQILAEHGERGTQILRRIEEACLVQDAEALSDGIDEFISLLTGRPDSKRVRTGQLAEAHRALQ